MKITLNTIGIYRPDSSSIPKQDSRSVSSRDSGNFDAITIHSNARQIQEKTFSEALSRQISAEVRQTASPERIHALQEQVAAGTYRIDPYAIASRLLLSGEAFRDV